MDQQKWNLNFVKEIEKYPCLYDHTVPDYTQKDVTEAAWDKIAEVMDSSGAACREKWRNLRAVYTRYLRQGKKKRYYMTEAMKFIYPHLRSPVEKTSESTEKNSSKKPRIETSSCSVVSSDEDEDKYTVGSIQKMKPINPLKLNRFHCHNVAINERVWGGASNSNVRTESTNKHFLLSILPEVDEMNSVQVKAFKRKVLALIDDIKNKD